MFGSDIGSNSIESIGVSSCAHVHIFLSWALYYQNGPFFVIPVQLLCDTWIILSVIFIIHFAVFSIHCLSSIIPRPTVIILTGTFEQ